MNLTIQPAKSINGTIRIPGDKSISHRALIFGSLCEGEVEVSNFLEAEDCLSTLNTLRQLGVQIEQSGSDLRIEGVGKYGFKAPTAPLDVGNSGTTLRIMAGFLAAQSFESTLIGDESVSERPMDRIINPLREMGAKIEGTNGHAPLHIYPPPPNPLPQGRGNKLTSISYKLPVASAQVKSAILLAGLFAEGQTIVSEEYKSRDHTERMLSYLEADIQISNLKSQISNVKNLIAKPIQIPGDFSSAAFLIIAALLSPGSELLIRGIGVNPTRIGLLQVLETSGAKIKRQNERQVCGEPVADLKISNLKPQVSNLKAFIIGKELIPLLVDEIPILAVAATQTSGTSVISGAQELRVKETDRLKAISTELQKMGAGIEEKPDGLIINGPTKLTGTGVDCRGDHRMAMSLAVAGLLADGQTVIKGAECINISFPGFSNLLGTITK